MKYWWVSQKAKLKHEFNGGYLWSSKKTKSDLVILPLMT